MDPDGGQYGSGSGSGSNPDPIRIQGFNDQKLKKNNSWKKNLIFFWSKTEIYLSLGLHKVCPGYRRSLQLTKEAIQHFKTWIFSTFVGHFCPPWSGSGSVFKLRIRIRIQWSDWIRIQYGSGSETLGTPTVDPHKMNADLQLHETVKGQIQNRSQRLRSD